VRAVSQIGSNALDRIESAQIVIINESTLQRENLASILATNGMAAPRTAWDIQSLDALLAIGAPDIVLLSMATRGKAALLRAVRDACPTAKVIVTDIAEEDSADVIVAAEAGVAGYHLRTESLAQLLNMIRKVNAGESVCSPKVAAMLLNHLSAMAARRRSEPRELDLTTREMQILGMLEDGLSNREIAKLLCITLHTVKNHVHSVLTKLGVSTRAEAAALSRITASRYPEQ
jgi:DNA-binding NarL/FixJ family response regulator